MLQGAVVQHSGTKVLVSNRKSKGVKLLIIDIISTEAVSLM